MTNLQTKKELNDEFKNVKYILTSGMRSRLLLSVYEKPKNLEELRNDVKKPSATILHGLKELENINLVRKVQKYYELTSNGYLLTTNMIKLIENWYSINKNTDFWNNHDLSNIPDKILKNMYLLKDGEYINSTTSDLSNAYTTYLKLTSKAEQLTIILPIYSENHFEHYIELLKKNRLKTLELIISENIFKSIEENDYFKNGLLNSNKVTVTLIEENPNIFLTYSDKFMSLTLFFKDGHYDDSQILIVKSKNALKWASDLTSILKQNKRRSNDRKK